MPDHHPTPSPYPTCETNPCTSRMLVDCCIMHGGSKTTRNVLKHPKHPHAPGALSSARTHTSIQHTKKAIHTSCGNRSKHCRVNQFPRSCSWTTTFVALFHWLFFDPRHHRGCRSRAFPCHTHAFDDTIRFRIACFYSSALTVVA